MACLAMNNTPGAILAALLAFDTTSRHSNLAMIDWIADFLAARGVASRRFYDPSGGKANLYARLGPSGGGGVMLSGHTDVVPVDGQAERSAFQPDRARWPLLWPRQRRYEGVSRLRAGGSG